MRTSIYAKEFNFKEFQEEAVSHLNSGESLTGKNRILTPLIKQIKVTDILIASIDGLKGFTETIVEIFPKTEIQLCVIHQIRPSLNYVISKDQKAFMADLKLV